MSGLGSFLTFVVAVLICMPVSAFAGGRWSNKCEQAGKKAQATCEASSNGAKAADNAQSKKLVDKNGKPIVHGGAEDLKQAGIDQAGRLNNAKDKCEEEKKKCSDECDKEEKDRQSKLKLPDTPQKPPIKTEAEQDQQVEEKKQSACIVPIAAIAGDLGNGAGDALAAALGAAAAAGAALANAKKNEDEKKALEETKKGDLTGSDKLNCAIEENGKYSDCNSHYIEKCQGSMTAAGCDAFINRYCGAYTPAIPKPTTGNDNLSLEAQSTSNRIATANLVVGKDGEGLGSAFCKKITAAKFCAMAGRSECPSCKNLNSPWPAASNAGQLADAQKACPSDPMFMDAAVQQQMNSGGTNTSAAANVSTSTVNDKFGTQSVTGAAGGGGSGGMGGGAGGAGTAPSPGSGVSEGSYSGPSLADGSGYGGGAGGSFEGSASGPGYEPASVNGDARRAPAAAGTSGGPRDVAGQYGPNIFSIQSTTYRSMCARGRFLHCRR